MILPTIARFRDIVETAHRVPIHQMVERHYSRMADGQFALREGLRHGITTPGQWHQERESLRGRLWETIGRYPEDAVQTRDMGVVETRDLIVKKILYSCLEDYWISANVYMPRNASFPLPGLIVPPGHNNRGKSDYALRASLLALNGYVALTFDLIGTGERQIMPYDRPYFTSTQHNILGLKMGLYGVNLMGLMVRETLAAVDVLQALAEVQKDRIGITGSSGGGWLSVLAAALDDRIEVTVPAAAVHSYKNGVAANDAEQNLYHAIVRGMDYSDIISFLIAPRPCFIVANDQDIWPTDSTRYVIEEAKRFYGLLGATDRLGMKVWSKGHTYDLDQVEEAVGWFDRWLKGQQVNPSPRRIDPSSVPTADDLRITKEENLFAAGYSPPGLAIHRHLQGERSSRDLNGFVAFIESQVPIPADMPFEVIDHYAVGDLQGRRLTYSPAESLILPVEVLMPPAPKGVMILLDEVDRREMPDWPLECAGRGFLTLRPDLRGWGETSPTERWADGENWSQAFYSGRRQELAGLCQIVGKDLTLERVGDVLALLSVSQRLCGVKDVTVWGRRGGALVALLAAVIDTRIAHLRLEKYIHSFQDIMARETPVVGPDQMVFGLLKYGIDIPDLLELVRRKTITRYPLDGLSMPMGVTTSDDDRCSP